jgi:hypothetical protein
MGMTSAAGMRVTVLCGVCVCVCVCLCRADAERAAQQQAAHEARVAAAEAAKRAAQEAATRRMLQGLSMQVRVCGCNHRLRWGYCHWAPGTFVAL